MKFDLQIDFAIKEKSNSRTRTYELGARVRRPAPTPLKYMYVQEDRTTDSTRNTKLVHKNSPELRLAECDTRSKRYVLQDRGAPFLSTEVFLAFKISILDASLHQPLVVRSIHQSYP